MNNDKTLQEIDPIQRYAKAEAGPDLGAAPARQQFADRLGSMLERAERGHDRLAVVLLDVDHFKRINAGFGHETGDALLHLISQRLQNSASRTAFIARLGGDEFAMVLTAPDNPSLVCEINAARECLHEPYSVAGTSVQVSLSLGYSLYPDNGLSATDLIRKADISLHQAKANGRNVVQGYTEGDSELACENLHLEAELRKALQNKELELYYQPQVSLATGELIGAEALMRWRHPKLGVIPPSRFIPLAEESGLILELGEWALFTAARQAHEWKKLSPRFQRVAVNVSGIQLNQSNLLAMVNRVLTVSAIDPTVLELELTESVVMRSGSVAVETLAKLHDRGLSIAVDDFGTGYSSLAYLQKLPIDKLKLDKSFIRDIASNPDDLAIARAIMGLGKSLRLTVTAEGVETTGQRDILEQEGCEQAQGFLYGQPMPAGALTELLGRATAG